MAKRFWLLVLLLAVPLLAFGAASGIKAHLDSEFRTALSKQFPDADPIIVAAAKVDQLCESDDLSGLSEICDTNASLAMMRRAAIWAAGSAIALLCLISLAGKFAQGNRALLVYVFQPGLYLTVTVLAALVLTHAALAMATIYFGEAVFVNRVHVGLILAIGIGAALGVLGMVGSSFSLVKRAQVTVVGRSVTEAEAPQLWAIVNAASAQLQALGPDHIVLGLDPNFFVTEANVKCLSGTLTGRTLFCSMPLARILNEEELCAIIGHELGHFKGDDTKFSERFYPIYRGTALSLQSLSQVANDGARAISLLPAIATLSYFYDSFAVAESHLSRERELAADAAGASVTSTSTLASALVKVHAFSGIWSGFDNAAADALRDGQIFTNASTLFASAVVRSANTASLAGLAKVRLSHPTDSHPPLHTRLQALNLDLSDVSANALNIDPQSSALTSVQDLETFEEGVSQVYQEILAKRLGIGIEADDSRAPSNAA